MCLSGPFSATDLHPVRGQERRTDVTVGILEGCAKTAGGDICGVRRVTARVGGLSRVCALGGSTARRSTPGGSEGTSRESYGTLLHDSKHRQTAYIPEIVRTHVLR